MNTKDTVDDQGTDQSDAARILWLLRDRAFEGSNERLALALGRPKEEIDAWSEGSELIDSDVVMKARGIAMERGIDIASPQAGADAAGR